ncbi:bola-like protein [Mucidula mucida]|nr:bola-like protein [Mucidula mucida]
MAASSTSRPLETSIKDKLTSLLQPSSLVIRNDSWQHRHHAAMRDHPAADGEMETHFTIEVVSDAFSGKVTMQRHRMIYAALAPEFEQGLHSVSLKTKTPAETLLS